MALNIPLPGSNADTLLKGLTTGSNMYSNIMQPIVQRQQLAQQMKVHLDNLAIQKQAQARLAEMAPLQRREAELAIQKLEMETDPAKRMAYIQAIMNGSPGA
jgi:hypothetical protein